MYISKKNKFAFFAVPRVASNSAQYVLQNSGISTSDGDIIYSLFNELTLPPPIDNTFLFDANSDQVKAYNNYHTTPTQAIERGLVTMEELREFNCFAFVRDPLEKWVSMFMLGKHFGLWSGDNVASMCDAIDTLGLGGQTAVTRFKLNFSWRYKDYFYYKDELVVTPYKLTSMDNVLSEVITNAGGNAVPTPTLFFGEGTPSYLKPIENWCSEDRLRILRHIFKEDIEFYERAQEK